MTIDKNYNLILSLNLTSVGTSGQVLTTDGVESLYWSDPGGGGGFTGTPGSIPYVGLGGTLTEDNDRLFWNESTQSIKLGGDANSIEDASLYASITGGRGNKIFNGQGDGIVGGSFNTIGSSLIKGSRVTVSFNDGLATAVPSSNYIGITPSILNPNAYVYVSIFEPDVPTFGPYSVNSGTHHYFWFNVTDYSYPNPQVFVLPSPESKPFRFSPTGGGPRNVIGHQVDILTTDTNQQIRNKFRAVVNATGVFTSTNTGPASANVVNINPGFARLPEKTLSGLFLNLISLGFTQGSYTHDASNSFIGGGDQNHTYSSHSAILGGYHSDILPASYASLIIGGQFHAVWGGQFSTILGGYFNETYYNFSVVMGAGAQDLQENDLAIGNFSVYDLPIETEGVEYGRHNHFRIAGDTSDVHIGRAVDQIPQFTPGYTNKLWLHTTNIQNQSKAVTLRAPDTLTSMVDLTLPDNVGTSGQFLTTDGAGILSWTSGGGGGGGLNNPVVINGVSYTFPLTGGLTGQTLVTDGLNTLSWDSPGAGTGTTIKFRTNNIVIFDDPGLSVLQTLVTGDIINLRLAVYKITPNTLDPVILKLQIKDALSNTFFVAYTTPLVITAGLTASYIFDVFVEFSEGFIRPMQGSVVMHSSLVDASDIEQQTLTRNQGITIPGLDGSPGLSFSVLLDSGDAYAGAFGEWWMTVTRPA